MVRLVVAQKEPSIWCVLKFQFLYGAIGGKNGKEICLGDKLVSIPIWCDWWKYRKKSIQINTMFQFLYGAIGGLNTGWLDIHARNVSIPIWCDWWGRMVVLLVYLMPSFNSYMVRLVGQC